MKLVANGVVKSSVERLDYDMGGESQLADLKNSSNISSISELKKEKATKILMFKFDYSADYLNKDKKKLATINLSGFLSYEFPTKKADALMKNYKNKTIKDDDSVIKAVQAALNLSQMEAIFLARHYNLPSPVRLGTVKQA